MVIVLVSMSSTVSPKHVLKNQMKELFQNILTWKMDFFKPVILSILQIILHSSGRVNISKSRAPRLVYTAQLAMWPFPFWHHPFYACLAHTGFSADPRLLGTGIRFAWNTVLQDTCMACSINSLKSLFKCNLSCHFNLFIITSQPYFLLLICSM